MLEGGCSCGEVRYAASGEPFHATLCHCVDCRRVAAAPATAWFSIGTADLRWTRGAPHERTSSAATTRSFCPACGTQLVFASRATPDELDIATCSLDDPAQVPPHDQCWTDQRVPWLRLDDALPSFPRGRAG